MPRLVLGDTAKPRNKSLIEPLGFVTLLGSVELIAVERRFQAAMPTAARHASKASVRNRCRCDEMATDVESVVDRGMC